MYDGNMGKDIDSEVLPSRNTRVIYDAILTLLFIRHMKPKLRCQHLYPGNVQHRDIHACHELSFIQMPESGKTSQRNCQKNKTIY
jgi:hypothetical protein